jgi:hypothetical protein
MAPQFGRRDSSATKASVIVVAVLLRHRHTAYMLKFDRKAKHWPSSKRSLNLDLLSGPYHTEALRYVKADDIDLP